MDSKTATWLSQAPFAGSRIMNVQVWPPSLEGVRLERRIETPLSYLFFDDAYVYKVKKPVKLDTLDFSTLSAREKACAREVRLNQALAPNVYVDVLPLFGDDEHLTLDGVGEPIEFCVRMRRLPADRMFDDRLLHDEVDDAQLHDLADRLVAFYRNSKASEKIARAGCPNALETNIRFSIRALREQFPNLPCLDLLESALLEFVAVNENDLADRIKRGKVRDGHGDLKPEHICFSETPVVFDRVEFYDRFRHVDVMDDVAGLVLEMDRMGCAEQGQRLWTILAEAMHENVDSPLFDFYRAYRALMRARFDAALIGCALDQTVEECRQDTASYIEAAAGYCRRFHSKRLMITFGLVGSGKSTLSQALANTIGVKRFSSEAIRAELLAQQPTGRRVPYTPEQREQVYGRLFELARQALDDGASVVLDASFTSNRLRLKALELAEQAGAEPLFIECRLSTNDAIARLDQRFKRDQTNAAIRPEVYHEHRQNFEPLSSLPQEAVVSVTTTATVPELVDSVLDTFVRKT